MLKGLNVTTDCFISTSIIKVRIIIILNKIGYTIYDLL